ncbi:MAG: UDP-N-acetylglucosamine--N-acetylmuramyl-(pentapeptide) pyrophosphoryl-undecaprenol N-acetylglucosamine transferase [Chloroflexi bacterium]|nr:MAG: UDP-N-acetylglucosamine--N-acetylmuramyl-(pentapeptide) pyrophosphoryl-undecaprenol N-acetylglucosamine transferase [Chloroflexota bacterium]
MEADLVAQYNIPYTSIPAAGVHGVGLSALPGNLIKLAKGTLQSRRILHEFQPDVLFFTGGYVAVPMAIAGTSVNSLVYVPDIEPGLALKSIARFSDIIALTAAESRQYFGSKKRMVVTGYPTRSDLNQWDRESARKELLLSNDLPVLLIIGGSKGARLINQAVLPQLPALLKKSQVVHLTGQADWQEAQNVKGLLPASMVKRYHPHPYLHQEIGAAFACADLVISRAGASTLGELPLFGLPAILVPYPFAWRYQKVNADYLASHGAVEVIENALLKEKLIPSVVRLLADQPVLAKMRESMNKLSAPYAATKIADLLVELSVKKTGEGQNK